MFQSLHDRKCTTEKCQKIFMYKTTVHNLTKKVDNALNIKLIKVVYIIIYVLVFTHS